MRRLPLGRLREDELKLKIGSSSVQVLVVFLADIQPYPLIIQLCPVNTRKHLVWTRVHACIDTNTASGLYYLSELVEEHTSIARKSLYRLIYFIITVDVLLWLIDGFPFWLSVMSVGSQMVYLQNLKRFPMIELTSPTFIGSAVLVLINHFLWFSHFSDPELPPASIRYHNLDYVGETRLPFAQVASYFVICIWLVPFSLFISLSASDYVLPSTNEVQGGEQKRRGASLAKIVVDPLRNLWFKIGEMFGYKRVGQMPI